MDDGCHACEQVLPGAEEQRRAPGNAAALQDTPAKAHLNVFGPAVGVWVGPAAKATVVIAMQMVVCVDQAGPYVGVRAIENHVELSPSPTIRFSSIATVRLRALMSIRMAQLAFRKAIARTMGRPRCSA